MRSKACIDFGRIVMFLVLLVSLASGCVSTVPARTFTTTSRGNAPLERLAFWHSLSTQPIAGNDDAFHGLLLFVDKDGKDPAANYEARVTALKARGLLPSDFSEPAGEPARRGTLAYALAKVLGLKGGLTMGIFGISPRYALKELEFRGLFPLSSPNQVMSGSEFVGIVSKARDYLDTGSADVAAVASMPDGNIREVLEDSDLTDDTEAPFPSVRPQELSLQPIFASMQQSGPATTSSTTSVSEIIFTATVEGRIVGDAQWKPNDTAEWRLLKETDVLNQDATVETGAASKVVLKIPRGQSLVIYQLTEITLIELKRQGGIVKTDVGMKHGRTEYEIHGSKVQYDSKVRSPNNTLAVRSTRVLLYEQPPFVPEAVSLHGRTDFIRKLQGDQVALGGQKGKVKLRGDQTTAASTALAQAVVDPTFANARTSSESQLIANLVSRGAVLSFDPINNIDVLTGGTPLKSTQNIGRELPGSLTFVLTWDQPAGVAKAANIDLLVTNSSGDILFPTGAFANSRNLGRVPFDHRGGPGGGIEFAYFPASYPRDLYYVSAVSTSGTADVTLRAFLNGKRLEITNDGRPRAGGTQFDIAEPASTANSPFGFVIPDKIYTESAPGDSRRIPALKAPARGR